MGIHEKDEVLARLAAVVHCVTHEMGAVDTPWYDVATRALADYHAMETEGEAVTFSETLTEVRHAE